MSYSPLNAQVFKKIFGGPKKQDLILKIDSLDSVIQEQQKYFLVLLNRQNQEINELRENIKSLEKENEQLSLRLDTTSLFLLKKEEAEAEARRVKNISTYCPDNIEAEKIEILKECNCYSNKTALPEIDMHGYNIVKKGIEMVVDTKELVKGSCWTYVDKVFNNAGYELKNRETIYKGKKGSKINDISLIRPGDWIYHINHSFHGVEHSAIFICWQDKERKIGITLSHVGQSKLRTGQFGSYDLKSVYNIIRAHK